MKKVLRIIALLLLWEPWSLTPTPSFGSETRVDSTGGLTTLLTDETTNLDLFMDGNPAGLALLNQQDRFDLSGQWFYSNGQPVGTGSVQQTFGTLPRLSDGDLIHYGGAMFFPEPQWALQVDGDLSSSQGLPFYTNDTYTLGQYRSLLRSAYRFGSLAVGLELFNIQSDQAFDPGLFNPPSVNGSYFGLQSGTSGQNQSLLRGGFIVSFPDKADDDNGHWQSGGYVGVQLGSSIQTQNLELFTSGSSPFSITRTTTLADSYSFVPEIRYEVPNRFILKFSCALDHSDQDFSQTVPTGTPLLMTISPSYRAVQLQSLNAIGEFKIMEPLSEKETVKLGGSLSYNSSDTNDLNPDQSLFDNITKQQLNVTLGAGMEALYDYLYGVQIKVQSYLRDTQPAPLGTPMAALDHSTYQVTLGGEKWFSSNWAFRLGLIFEEDAYNQGAIARTLDTAIVTGVGYDSLFWKLDLKLMAGQSIDANNSSNLSTQTSAGISGTFFL